MTIFVLDNNIFSIAFRNLPFDIFSELWETWEKLIENDIVISVSEVYEELINYWDTTKTNLIGDWIKNRKNKFLCPTDEEGVYVSEIFKNKKFQEGIKERSLRNGTPEADAFIVAKAKHVKGIVVTNESNSKPNSDKIPNICSAFGVQYIGRDDFYRVLKNVEEGRKELEGIVLK